ncbi:glycosyltransferase family 4 protein [Actinobacillus equuli]|uniref:glycosyltransferase family 4 protein n=1 Tax=Actinobacillus equuli TaxID=718 RepID=UPI002441B316|nr:glycosyltransferase family 4 protein [Actinobacillus equuli]WGE59225.1 glycosyltransferase family 4 protein [Actinobacillus equuli subsp. haemolyticus]WGE62134.1 glycosyltransferase family 4 protein [Actinobacillus equuli subsp. haemolyticus]
MKKIVLIGNIASMITNFRKELVIELVSRGYTVYCYAYGYTEKEQKEVSDWGAIPKAHFINPKGMNPVKDLKAVYLLMKELKQLQPDIAFSTFIKPVIFGSLAAKLARVPKVIGMIEGLGNAFTPYKEGKTRKAKIVQAIQVLLYKISLPFLDKLIFLNPDDKKDLIDTYRISTKSTAILGGIGVDPERFGYQEVDITKEVSFLFIARLLKEKGIFEYLEAAKKIKAEYPTVRFTIIGGFDEGNPFAISKDALDDYIKHGVIEYLGYVDNVPEVIANSSVFVLPSYREGVPRSTQEAMAIGRAVITTDVPGCRETVVHRKNGLLVPVYSVDELAQAMRYFVENKQEILNMGIESRKMAEQKFDIAKVNDKLISILEES